MGLGILDLLELAVVVALAIPIALLGVQFLVDGSLLLGGGFLAMAAGLVWIKQFLPSPTDVPKEIAQQSVSTIANEDTDGDE